MPNTHYVEWPTQDPVEVNGPASLAISVGDLLYYDSATGTVKPATSQTTLASEALDQVQFARNFAGVSKTQRLSTDANAGPVRFRVEGVYEFPCVSNTFDVGDFVGVTWDGGAALVNQKVAKVSNWQSCIGIVVKRYGSATTTVKCRLISRKAWDACHRFSGIGGFQGAANSNLADADVTLTVASNPIQVGVPTAARKVILPAAAQSGGFVFFVINNSASAFALNIRDPGDTTTLASVAQNKRGIAWCDGTTWYAGPFA